MIYEGISVFTFTISESLIFKFSSLKTQIKISCQIVFLIRAPSCDSWVVRASTLWNNVEGSRKSCQKHIAIIDDIVHLVNVYPNISVVSKMLVISISDLEIPRTVKQEDHNRALRSCFSNNYKIGDINLLEIVFERTPLLL